MSHNVNKHCCFRIITANRNLFLVAFQYIFHFLPRQGERTAAEFKDKLYHLMRHDGLRAKYDFEVVHDFRNVRFSELIIIANEHVPEDITWLKLVPK